MTFKSYKGPRAGSWYDVPNSFFENFQVNNELLENVRVRASLEPHKGVVMNLQQYKMYEKLYINEMKQVTFKDSKFYNDIIRKGFIAGLELTVRNVGCGNWNEISGENFKLIYDLGGDIKFSSQEMENIFLRVNLNKPYIGVISHWDLDHYRAILDMDESKLRLMQYIVVPSKMPNTLQMKKTIERLLSLNIHIDIIKSAIKISGTVDLISQGKIGNFELFRSTDGANINQSGILLTVEGNKKIGVLTGDHYYPQILRSVLNNISFKPYEFVVPHHGGNAGTFKKNLWKQIHFSSGALSTTSGRYRNLPKAEHHNFFVWNRSFHCTEYASTDYSTIL